MPTDNAEGGIKAGGKTYHQQQGIGFSIRS
jgi:hypothetical protein